jgi:hypothetical protein
MPNIGGHFLMLTAWLPWSKLGRNTTAGSTMLNPDSKEFIQLLNDNQARYLVVGGYAVALHGYPRYTKDIDIWIDPTPDNASKVIRALDQFGFGSLGLKSSDFLETDQIIQLGYPPNRIDLMTSLPGVDFDSCYAVKVEVTINKVVVNFIDLENLLKNKKSAGRSQDLADIENLGD